MDTTISTAHPFSSWNAGKPSGYFDQIDPDTLDRAVAFYGQSGYAVLEGGCDPHTLAQLIAETTALCRGERGEIEGVIPAGQGETDAEVLRRYICIHFPHKLSDIMAQALAHPTIVSFLTRIISPNVKCMQSMLFIKASGKPGQAWHQDEFYIPTRDRSLTGAWIALDDATVVNGCLWLIPGSHQHGVLWPQHQHEDARFDCAGEAVNFPYTDADAVPVEVKAGSIVFFNGYLLHRSLPNYAPGGYRRSLVNHYMSAESLLPWFRNDEVGSVAAADFRDVVLVAGTDPYAWKGYDNSERARPHVRRDREGGCGTPERDAQVLRDRNMVG